MSSSKTFLTAFFLVASFAQAQTSPPSENTLNPPLYCNGQVREDAGETYFANGQRTQVSGDNLYPNGTRIIQSGEVVYPNGQRMQISGEDYYMSGQRVVISGDLYYPNGQRVQIGSDCFFQSGVKMNQCPVRVRVEDENDEGVTMIGLLDLKTHQVFNREFALAAPDLTITWRLEKDGTLSNLRTQCDSLLL